MPPLIPLKSINFFSDIFGFRRTFISLRAKLSLEGTDCMINENIIICYPYNSTLSMKRKGSKFI